MREWVEDALYAGLTLFPGGSAAQQAGDAAYAADAAAAGGAEWEGGEDGGGWGQPDGAGGTGYGEQQQVGLYFSVCVCARRGGGGALGRSALRRACAAQRQQHVRRLGVFSSWGAVRALWGVWAQGCAGQAQRTRGGLASALSAAGRAAESFHNAQAFTTRFTAQDVNNPHGWQQLIPHDAAAWCARCAGRLPALRAQRAPGPARPAPAPGPAVLRRHVSAARGGPALRAPGCAAAADRRQPRHAARFAAGRGPG